MDRLTLWRRAGAWAALERRRWPLALPAWGRVGLSVALLACLGWNLTRDIAYLRTIPIDDIFAYECYARAFWHGPTAVRDAPHTQLCADPRWRFWVAPPRAYHTLPREYPAPALAVFSLPLLAPFAPYDVAYMTMLAALLCGVAAWLLGRGLFLCAAACTLYTLVGGWATALARYDLVPGALALAALACAQRSRYSAAYLALAAAALLKIYPALLIPVLVIHQRRATGRWPWPHLALCAGAAAVGLLPGVLLDPVSTLQPLAYNGLRPPQIESLAGSLLWLSGKLGADVQVRFTYHSLNVAGAGAGLAAWAATVLLVGGLALTCWRAWRGDDTLARSFVLALLVTLCGAKLLSPQYLLWLFPVAAYAEGLRLRWTLLAVLTVAIYPHAYGFHTSLVRLPDQPFFMTSILCRNAVLLAMTIAYATAGAPRVSLAT